MIKSRLQSDRHNTTETSSFYCHTTTALLNGQVPIMASKDCTADWLKLLMGAEAFPKVYK